MTDVAPQTAPEGLREAGLELWQAVTEQVAADGLQLDARELRILRDACRTADDLTRIESALADATPIVIGSTGQPRPNPLYDEARKARALIANTLKLISLSAPDDKAGTGSRTTSWQARAAAAARHGGVG